jgi:restriction endonuclease S subunit
MATTKAKIGDVLISTQSGFACSKQYEATEKTGVLHLRPNNVGYWGVINLSKKVYIQKNKIEPSKVGIKKGQLLFNNTNSKELVGRVAIALEDIDAGFSNHITRLIVDETKIDPRWLTHQINKLWADKYFFHLCKKWIGQAGVDTTMLKNVEIEYPDLAEQKSVADKLDKVYESIEVGKIKVSQNKHLTSNLAFSILDTSFTDALKSFPMKKLGEILDYEQPTEYIVHSVDYNNKNSTPVLTAGKTFILGYTNEKTGICEKNLPVIIFDDFTTAIKIVDFPFKVKSSAMKILHTDKSKASIKFLFYAMQRIVFPVTKHKRHWISEYSNIQIPLPPLAEQRRITDELEKSIALSDKLINLLDKQEKLFVSLRSSVLNQSFVMQT